MVDICDSLRMYFNSTLHFCFRRESRITIDTALNQNAMLQEKLDTEKSPF